MVSQHLKKAIGKSHFPPYSFRPDLGAPASLSACWQQDYRARRDTGAPRTARRRAKSLSVSTQFSTNRPGRRKSSVGVRPVSRGRLALEPPIRRRKIQGRDVLERQPRRPPQQIAGPAPGSHLAFGNSLRQCSTIVSPGPASQSTLPRKTRSDWGAMTPPTRPSCKMFFLPGNKLSTRPRLAITSA